jgi:hypothetical protein
MVLTFRGCITPVEVSTVGTRPAAPPHPATRKSSSQHSSTRSWLTRVLSPDHHHRQQAPSSPGLPKDTRPRTSSHGGLPHADRKTPEPAPAVQQPSLPSPATTPPTSAQKIPTKRPNILGRAASDKPGSVTPPEFKSPSRKNSWISSVSSKFSSQKSPAQTTHAQAQGSPAPTNGTNGSASQANGALSGLQAAANGTHSGHEPYVPQQPKGSFIGNALRRLSSGTQVGTIGKVTPNGGVCPRRVLNIDPNRNRCLVPELNENKLRRVAFCVDVEIAGGPKYTDEGDTEEKRKKKKDKKIKERGEGEALKHPESVAEEKEKQSTVSVCATQEEVGNAEAPNPEGAVVEDDKQEPSRKKEKKKRSEAERKERKEKKRRKAEENGSVPLELTREDDEGSADTTADAPGKPAPKHQDRPTIDPLRIYRRCCQLRETPILKRISDQLSAPSACAVVTPGVVTCLDLTGSRMQLADIVTLSDWLAIVPVKKLLLEDAELNDEKVRVVLAGLLAAKIPESSKRRPASVASTSDTAPKANDRSGVVNKLVLKNNPKITAEGWRHIALFIYMCKSLIALDVSMVPFPKPAPKSAPQSPNTPQGSTVDQSHHPKGVAEVLSKAISERLGGSRLEELLVSECNLTSTSIRSIIDGCVMSGVQRLGLAGNDIDNEGLGHVINYIRSGVCQGLDLGGNAIRSSLGRLAESFTKECKLWALSVADCDLTPDSLKILFPALVTLPNLRFLDFSHNRNLFSHQTSLCLLRKYLPQFTELKRIHLADVSLTPAEAIAIAEILPECALMAHVNILENPKISALATATDEEAQEEAAALYASLTVAAKISRTLISIDVDVPSSEANEIVKALAKQVVAYCLRNMENSTEIPELKSLQREVEIPDVLMHIVGHTDDNPVSHDNDPLAPDEDYIVGGTGVAKALSYCLLQKATDLRRQSLPTSGTMTPRTHNAELEELSRAKTMSKTLLENARNIRQRLQPALLREARGGNDMAHRKHPPCHYVSPLTNTM